MSIVGHQSLNKEFEESIQDAYLLLSYAIQKGISVEKSIIEVITDFKGYFDADNATKKLYESRESEFWNAFSNISKIIGATTKKEVTIESIKNSSDFYRKSTSSIFQDIKHTLTLSKEKRYSMGSYSLIDTMLFRYRSLTYILLFSFISIQIYWYIGQSLNTDGKEINSQIVTNNKTFYAYTGYNNYQHDVNNNRNSDSIFTTEDFHILKIQIKKTAFSLISNSTNIYKWNLFWKKIFFFPEDSTMDHKMSMARSRIYKQFPKLDSLMPNEGDMQIYLDYEKYINWLDSINQIQIKNLNFILNVIPTYILPLLAALLGTLGFILRSISYKIKTDSFSIVSKSDYKLRMTLGALAGVSVGWFSTYNSISFSYSPLILAFAVGYNIEAIFRFVDGVLFKYLSKSKDKEQTSNPSKQ